MREVDGLSEAPAVHGRIEYYKQKCQECEQTLQRHGCHCHRFPPYSGDEGCADYGFREGEGHAQNL